MLVILPRKRILTARGGWGGGRFLVHSGRRGVDIAPGLPVGLGLPPKVLRFRDSTFTSDNYIFNHVCFSLPYWIKAQVRSNELADDDAPSFRPRSCCCQQPLPRSGPGPAAAGLRAGAGRAGLRRRLRFF